MRVEVVGETGIVMRGLLDEIAACRWRARVDRLVVGRRGHEVAAHRRRVAPIGAGGERDACGGEGYS